MKFLKSLFLKIKAKKTLKTYQKPLLMTLLTLLLINVLVLVVGALIGMALDERYYNNEFFGGRFISAFVGSVKWMISPNSLTQLDVHDHLKMTALAIVVVLIGMVLFSGAIIATVTTALRAYIDKKSHAKGKILVDDHFVILNWNSKVPDMVYNLMIKGFKNNIVILSQASKSYIESEIKSLFLTNEVDQKFKANLIIKEGDSLLRSNLEDISIEQASQICIMARDDVKDVDDDNVLNSDLLNLKIVLRLGSFKIRPDCQIVIETDSDEMRGQIENLSHKVSSLKTLNIVPASFNRKIGQIIARTLVTPKMSELYNELFSFEGAEFYSLKTDETIDSFMKRHNAAIPVYKENRLFVLAEDESAISKRRDSDYETDAEFVPIDGEDIVGAAIFIIGDNRKKRFLLESLEKSQEFGGTEFQLRHFAKLDNAGLVAAIKHTPGPKKVLILSDDTVSEEAYDANVFVTLIELSKAFPNDDSITYITELLDSRNLSSVRDFNIQNTIISNKMMSLLITQLAMNLDSKQFYDKILTTADSSHENDFDLVMNRADNLIEIHDDMEFECIAQLLRTFYNTFNGKKILIGLYQNDQITLLNRNQDKKEKVVVKKDASFIYFKMA